MRTKICCWKCWCWQKPGSIRKIKDLTINNSCTKCEICINIEPNIFYKDWDWNIKTRNQDNYIWTNVAEAMWSCPVWAIIWD